MKVVEIFNSIDGEGIRAGELTTFIRLFGCNLQCSYCDTAYGCKQLGDELPYKEMGIEDIIKECQKYKTKNITVTGGEPLIHTDISYLLAALSELNYNVNVETNGSISIEPYYEFDTYELVHKQKFKNVWFTVDYKCPSSKMNDNMCLENFSKSYRDVVYKFVVGNDYDLQIATNIIKDYLITFKAQSNYIYLSPVFGEIEPKQIVEKMQKENLYNSNCPIRIQLQLHKFIWPVEQRGV